MATIAASFELTQERIDHYGRVNGDAERLHYDAAYARERGFRNTIAHGTMLAAPLVDLALRRFGSAFLGSGTLSLKWTAPVCAGDRLAVSIDDDGRIEGRIEGISDPVVGLRGEASCGGAAK